MGTKIANSFGWKCASSSSAAALLMAALLVATPAWAQTALEPNSQVIPDPFNPAPGNVVTFRTEPASAADWSAFLSTVVVRNELGTLDFYFQVKNIEGGTGSIARLQTDSFDGFNTSVFYRTDDPFIFDPGTEAPELAARP
jgi:hypothetical protein